MAGRLLLGCLVALLAVSRLPLDALGQQMQNPPMLLSFDLNLNLPEQLILTFDSAVVPSTCNVQLLTLQNTSSSNFAIEGSLIPNMNGSCISGSTSSSIQVQLAEMDWLLLQGNIYLATGSSNTYLSALPGFIQDSDGVGSAEVMGLRVNTFTPNTMPPMLITGGLDFSAGSLGLIFDKAIALSSIVPTGVTLNFMNTSTNAMDSLTLSNAEMFGYFDTGSQIFIMLVRAEFFSLKLTSMDPYTVSITGGSFTDVFGIANQPQNNVELFNVAPDFDPPIPMGFSFDLNSGFLVITFQEPMSIGPGDYDLSEVYLTGMSNIDADTAYNVSNSTLTSSAFFDSELTITLSPSDLNTIKLDPTVCTNALTCFLITNESSFIDSEGNFAMATITPVIDFISDTTPPQLLAYSMDLNEGVLSLTFSEAILTDTIDFSQFSVYGVSGSGTPVSLIGSDFNSTDYDTILRLILEASVLNPIKSLAISGSVSLAVTSNAATDTAGNSLVSIPSFNAISPTTFVPDTTPPNLTAFTPGYPEQRTVTFIFDEYVNPSTWNGNQFTLVLTTRQGQFEYPGFTQGTISNGVSNQLVYTFSATEFMPPFSDHYVNAYYLGLIILEPGAGLIADVSGNVFSGLSTPLVYRNATLPPDTDKPTLTSYTLDLDTGTINFTFSEAVTIQSVADQVTIQDSPTSPVNTYTLMNSGLLTSILASEFITLVMNMTDLNNIKSNAALGTSVSNTYLVVNELFAMDLFNNLLENITEGLQASSVIPDTQRPLAIRSKVNINNAQITLEFSEPMSASANSIDFAQVYLGSSSQSPSSQYNLSGSVLLEMDPLLTRFTFMIAPAVLQAIQFDTSVCSGLENCFLFLTGDSFRDISGNAITPLTTGLLPTEFIPDMTAPQLRTFNLDLNTGSMRLTFSEPTDTAGFNPNGITLSPTDPGTSVMPSDAFIANTANLNTILTLTLGSASLNNIKVLYLSGGIQLTLASTTIMDTAGNAALPIPNETPLLPEFILLDLTPPTLKAFTPSPPSEHRFTFVFDEYISASSWDGSRLFITFSSAQGSREYTNFDAGTVTPMYSDTINYTYSTSEFIAPLSTDYTNAYTAGSFSLRSDFNWVQDLGFNALAAITTPIRFTNDTNRPTLNSFTLDLNSGTLTLVFNEPVSINTVVNQVRIQSSATSPSRVYSLSSNGTLSIAPGAAAMSVTVILGQNDINSIKFDQALATTLSNTYLVVLEGLGSDVSGNPLVSTSTGVQATDLIPDSQGPVLRSTAVDMNSGMVMLRFSEPVSQNVDLSQIFITGNAQNSPGGYPLTGSVVNTPTELATLVTIILSFDVVNMIKVDTQVCTQRSNCFIFYSSSSFSDVSGNSVVQPAQAVSVSNYTEDATSPELSAYTVDLNQGQLVLTFSEATNGMLTTPSGITLFGTVSGSGSIQFDFMVNTTFQAYNTILVFSLDSSRLNQLKVISSTSALGLSIQSITIYNNNNIPVVAIPMSSPLAPSQVIADSTPPRILMFIPGYPMERRMTLVFDEFVNPATWDGNTITLMLTTVQGSTSYTSFTQGTLTSMVTDRIVYAFSAGDLTSQFTNQYTEAYYEGMVAFLARSGLIQDISGNAMMATTTPFVFQNMTSMVGNTPALTSFDLDMNTGTLLLSFSEDIVVSRVAGQVQLQNAQINPTQSYTLSQDGTLSNTAISTVLSLTLDPVDLNNIKLLTFLATSSADSFLLIMNGFGRDTMNNPFNSSLNGAVQAAVFTPDSTPPAVQSFDLFNDDNGSMIISFNEPINFGSVDITLITLISGPNSPLTFTLTDGVYSDLSGSRQTLLFILSQSDLASIRQTVGLADGQSTTYLVLGANMCRDLVGNQILPVPNLSPIQVGNYVEDMGAASLQAFRLDMNFGSLTLTFNDIIDITTVNVGNLTIQNSSTSASNSYTLTASRMTSTTSSTLITIDMSFTDWNSLRSNLYLATSQANTFISFPSTFASTVGNVPLLGIPPTNAQLATMYQPDTQRLQLSLFAIDFNNGQMRFEFLKPVLVSSVNPTAIRLQNSNAVSPTAFYQLTGGEVLTSVPVSLSVDIQLTLTDIRAMNTIDSLANSADNTYISYVGNFINDTSGNTLLPLTMQVSSFAPDTGPPRLMNVDANLTSSVATLTLQFSKSVSYLSGSQSSFTLQNSRSNPQTSLILNTMDAISQPSRDTLVITLRESYSNILQSSSGIGSSADQLFITLSSTGVSDFFGNPAVMISSDNAMRVRYIYRVCDSNSYNNIMGGTCDQCSSVCVGGCTGNLTTAVLGGCNMCNITLLNFAEMRETCISQVSTCPQGYYTSTTSYPNIAQLSRIVCSPCHPECSICNGALDSNCQACSNAIQTASGGSGIAQCVSSCPNVTTTSGQCYTCHAQCNGCQGPTNRDCLSCRENNVTTSDQEMVCVAQCAVGEYFNTSLLNCQPCNTQCVACVGPANTQCLQCKGASMSSGGRTTCLTTCPIGMYQSASGTCMACHELCAGGCFGPENTDCNACLGNSVTMTSNVTMCVSDCQFAHSFDTSADVCKLSKSAMIAIIVCAIVGGILLLLVIVVLVICCVCCGTRKGKLTIKSDAPLIPRTEKDDAYTYGEDYNVSFKAASSHL